MREPAADARRRVVEPDLVIGTPCDVFAPCASGTGLDQDTIPRLRCPVVAGAANNQLATSDDADRLRTADILYAPDFVINAGGVIHLAGLRAVRLGRAPGHGAAHRDRTTLERVFEEAERDGTTTLAAAERLAAERLAAGRA